jgi:putative aldouronate transport system substrate-binding protein
MKKIALLMVLMIVLSQTDACSNEGAQAPASPATATPVDSNWGSQGFTSGGVKISDPNQFPIVQTPGEIELEILVTGHPAIEDWSTNAMSRWMEEKTGIKVNYKTIPLEGRAEALGLELASSDYPDAIMSAGISSELTNRYGAGEGRLLPLNDLIAAHAPNMRGIYSKYPGTEGQMTMLDGNVYTMPVINQCYHCTMYTKMWMNQTFLDNLGLEMPTTTDELVTVLKAFRDQDANGNGDASDEIPFAASSLTGWGTFMEYFIMNAFTFYDGQLIANMSPIYSLGLYLDNGTVKTPWAEPNFLEGLKFMNMLYEEGLLYEGSTTIDDVQLINLVESGDAPRVGMAPGGYGGIFSDMSGDRYEQYVPMMPLEGPEGLRQLPKNTYDLGFNGFNVATDSEYPEAAVKWADLLYDFEATMNGYFGPKGTHWTEAEAGAEGLDGNPALYKVLVPWQEVEPQNDHWVQMSLSNRDAAFRAGETYDTSIPLYSPEGLEKLLFETTLEMEPYANTEQVMPPVKFTDEQTNANSVPLTDISTMLKQYIPGFITGSYDIDTEYDGFLTQLNDAGLETLVSAYQAAYDQQYK